METPRNVEKMMVSDARVHLDDQRTIVMIGVLSIGRPLPTVENIMRFNILQRGEK